MARQHESFSIDGMLDMVNDSFKEVKEMLADIKTKKSEEVSIGQMFELQFKMNNASQISEMNTAVIAASNTAILSMTRNLKQ
ncbi:DUF5407 family protein [Criblamydia sequanensis]|uniref:Uncharacterized protein n=1 Tax=Candidatus Criblamydia sequanensis CRIB-18 TaxID=1437425 RepID=A0A090DZ58_9BACT|nr:DUF5407 family protein [Criblamydia sequanensis]CDR33974.1 Conserved hypothetical protein [Criblamydia sequanensis CRIB-18]